MGNNESNPIRNMDKRTARREYRSVFMRTISSYRKRRKEGTQGNDDLASPARDVSWATESDQNIRVCVRKRPIFKHEIEDYEFDVVSAIEGRIAVVHDGRMHTDMRRYFMNHHQFVFDKVFDEKTNNDEVYKSAVAPLARFAVVEGGYCTCLVYGQTGSGKTFTMSSIYIQAAEDVFSQLDSVGSRYEAAPVVSISFIELAGDNCFDLLNGFTPAQLLSGVDGSVHAFPVVEPEVSSAEELAAMIAHGFGVRSTAATGVHDSSSRSHAILRIYVQRGGAGKEGEESSSDGTIRSEGVLTLVDLAGSEHRIDSMYHSADRRKEGACINASLMALKECIRARAAGQNASHQYRKSKLTMALKASFLFPTARTLIIATVSPASKDTEHSLNTLRHACIMDGQQETYSDSAPSAATETRFVTGGTVEREECGEVDVTDVARKNMAVKKSTGKDVDARTSNGNGVQLVESQMPETTERQRAKSRRASEKRMFAKLSPDCKTLLSASRELLGNDRRQQMRLRRGRPVQSDTDVGAECGGASDGSSRWEVNDKRAPPESYCNRYGGSGVQSHGTAQLDSGREKEEERVKERERTREREKEAQVKQQKRELFRKLHESVYSSSQTVPEALLKRQLATLMKLNGFSSLEISAALPPSETDDLLLPSPPRGEAALCEEHSRLSKPSSSSSSLSSSLATKVSRPGRRPSVDRPMDSEGRVDTLQCEVDQASMSGKSRPSSSIRKPPTPLTFPSPSPSDAFTAALKLSDSALNEGNRGDGDTAMKKRSAAAAAASAAAMVEQTALTRKTRQEQAKAVRDKLDADKRAALLRKMGRSSEQHQGGGAERSPRSLPGEVDSKESLHAMEIARLEAALREHGITAAEALSISKQIQSHQAIILRSKHLEARRREGSEEACAGQMPHSNTRVFDSGTEDADHVVCRPRSAQQRPQTPTTKSSPSFRGEPYHSMMKTAVREMQGVGASPRAHPQAVTSAARQEPSDLRSQLHGQVSPQGSQQRDSMDGFVSGSRSGSGRGGRPGSRMDAGAGRGVEVEVDWGDSLEREVLSNGNGTTGHNRSDYGFERSTSRSSSSGGRPSSGSNNSNSSSWHDGPHRQREQGECRATDSCSYRAPDVSQGRGEYHQHAQTQQQQQPRQRMSSQNQHQEQSFDPDQDQRHRGQVHHHGESHRSSVHQSSVVLDAFMLHKPRMSIQQQHKLEYEQEELYLQQRQKEREQLLWQQQQRDEQQREREQLSNDMMRQRNHRGDPEPVQTRHLRSNPVSQQHVGAAAAPWANELTWDQDR